MGAGAARTAERPCFSGLAAVAGGGARADGGESLKVAMRNEPIRVAISGAAGHIAYALLPMIANGDMFGQARRVVLQCLDLNLPQVVENMRGIEMELQDGNFPLLHEAVFTIDDAQAFSNADYAILIGAYPQQEAGNRRDSTEKNVMIFKTIGDAINRYAKKECKVLVVGHPAPTNALICAYYAPSLRKENFFGLVRLDVNRALGQVARRAKVNVSDVRNIIVWGSHIPDLDHATVKGKPVSAVLSGEEDRQWMCGPFVSEMQSRGVNIHRARKGSSALSAARAIVDQVHDLYGGTRPGEFTPMGVWSEGNTYGIAEGLYFSLPVACDGRGRYRVVAGVNLGVPTRQRLREAEQELLAERELAMELIRQQEFTRIGAIHPPFAL